MEKGLHWESEAIINFNNLYIINIICANLSKQDISKKFFESFIKFICLIFYLEANQIMDYEDVYSIHGQVIK